MPISRDTFVEHLTASGLMSPEALEELLESLPRGRRPQDGAALARWLVERGHLTPYQATQVYCGRVSRLVLDNYVVIDELGAGGMGQVFMAEHQRMKRKVALKLLPENVASDPNLVARFHREVQAAGRLMHPNIVTAFDADEANGVHFLVMEYVPGKDLASLVRKHGPLPVHQAISCILDAARGLEYAHRHGITHRDIKPANLLLSTETGPRSAGRWSGELGKVKILDLGVARIEGTADGVTTQAELTGTGVVIGTVDYMSPEQALETRNADHRSDIYSLGMTMYFLLTGKPAYAGDSALQRFVGHREHPIPSLRAVRDSLPTALDETFAKMVAKQPQDRFQSMSDVIAALEEVQSCLSEPIPGDVTAVAVPRDADTAMQGFLQVIGEGSAASSSSTGVARVATVIDGEDSETAIANAGATGITPAATSPSSSPPPPPPRRRQWVWPAVAGSSLLGLLLLFAIRPGEDQTTDRDAAPTTSDGATNSDAPATFADSEAARKDRFALRFDAPDACVLVPALPLDLTQPFTWEAWCRPEVRDRISNVGRFVGQLGPVQLKIWQDHWQSPLVDVASGGASGVFLESPLAPATSGRAHVAFQWTGQQPRLFVDGIPAPEQLRGFNLSEPADEFVQRLFQGDGAVPLMIGNFEHGEESLSDGDSGEFRGTIVAVRVSRGLRYQDAFQPTELVADAQTLALYDFHEGQGDVLHDVSGHGHDGTIRDATWADRSSE